MISQIFQLNVSGANHEAVSMAGIEAHGQKNRKVVK